MEEKDLVKKLDNALLALGMERVRVLELENAATVLYGRVQQLEASLKVVEADRNRLKEAACPNATEPRTSEPSS